MPSSVYSGQNRTRLVSRKTPATTNATNPAVPVMTLVKYNAVSSMAAIRRIILSADPMLIFMTWKI